MSYDVIRHAAISGPFKFMKVIPDAVYFNTPDGSNQLVIHMDEKYHNARGNDVLTKLRNEVLGRGRKATPDELIKAAKAYVDQFSSVKHSDDPDDDPDILTDDDVEIIEAPYPENGKAQIPRRSFIYDDEDGYPQDYFEHHGILGMKWGVRRYQNADGSLTDEGRKHYGASSKYTTDSSSKFDKKRAIAKYGHESWQMQRQAKKALKKGDEKLAKEYNKFQKESRDKQKELRSQFADERVARYGKNTAIAGELGKEFVRNLSISVISTGSAFLLGPLSLLLAVPISAISLQSGYVATRNIVDIADSNKIPKEDKYREKEEKKK